MKRMAGALAACLMMSAGGGALATPVAVQTVALSGDERAGTDGGTFRSFRAPVINDAGQVAFQNTIFTTDDRLDEVLYVADGQGGYVAARRGQAVPELNAELGSFVLYTINDTGQLAFNVRVPNGDGPGQFGVFRADRNGTSLLAAPDGPVIGTEGATFRPGIRPKILSDGRVVTAGQLRPGSGGSNIGGDALVIASDEGLTLLAAERQDAPGTDGLRFGSLTDQSLGVSEGGRIAFGAALEDARGRAAGSVLYGGTPDDLQILLESGEALPGADGVSVFNFSDIAVNDAGQVAFEGRLQNNRVGLFLTDGELTTSLVYSGDAAPDTQGGVFTASFDRLNLNAKRDVAFRASFEVDGDRSAGLFGIDGDGTLVSILQIGDMLEVADGDIREVTGLDIAVGALNDAGLLAFTATFQGGRSSGIFLADVFGGDIVADAVPLPPAAALFAVPAFAFFSRRRHTPRA